MNNNPVRYNDPSGHRVCDDERGCEGEIRYKKRTPPQPPQPPQPQSNNQACTGPNPSIVCLPTPTPSAIQRPDLPVGPLAPVLPTPGPSYQPAPISPGPIIYPEIDNEQPYIHIDWDRVDQVDLSIDAIGIGGDVIAAVALRFGAAPVAVGAEAVSATVEVIGFAKSGVELWQGDPNSFIRDLSEGQMKIVMISRFGRVIPGFGIILNGVSIWANLRPEIRTP